LLPYILFEKYVNILALQVASPENRHCANCIGTLSYPMSVVISHYRRTQRMTMSSMLKPTVTPSTTPTPTTTRIPAHGPHTTHLRNKLTRWPAGRIAAQTA